jgi:hypothetical protein
MSTSNPQELETRIETMLIAQKPQQKISGLTCSTSADFFEREGIDDAIRESALRSLRRNRNAGTSSKPTDSGACDVNTVLSTETILKLKKISVARLTSTAAAQPELAAAIGCLKQKSVFKDYVSELRAASERVWSGLSMTLKNAIVAEIKAQNPAVAISEATLAKELIQPSKEFLRLLKQTNFCFVDLQTDSDASKNYFVSVREKELKLIDVGGFINDLETKNVGGEQ